MPWQYQLSEKQKVLAEADMRRCPRCRRNVTPREPAVYNSALCLVWHAKCVQSERGPGVS